ncbi:hypothetical protein GCM10027516_35050 [Niabella aquatica]
MIYIFKTSVFTEIDIQSLQPHLDELQQTQWNFDLEDCDKILRVDCLSEISEEVVIKILQNNGFDCEVLLY